MPRTPPSVACQYCGAVFRAGNHTTRLEPRLKLNKKLRKLMTRQQSGEKLGRFQQKVITMYIASNNRVVSFRYNIKLKQSLSHLKKRTKIAQILSISIHKHSGPDQFYFENCTI